MSSIDPFHNPDGSERDPIAPADPKPVELTEAEMDAIIKAFFPFDHSCAHNCGPVFDVIEGIIKAREAAARREALLEAKRAMCAECASRVDEESGR